MPSSRSRSTCSRAMSSRPSRERSQPARSSACAAVPRTRIAPTSAMSGPERREQRRASATCAPRRCRRRLSGRRAPRAVGTRAAARPTPSSRRSAGRRPCTSWSSSGEPHGGSPRQRRNTGRSQMSSGWTMRRGRLGARSAQLQLDHLRADVPVRRRARVGLERHGRVDAGSPASGSGRAGSCGTGGARPFPRARARLLDATPPAPMRCASSPTCACSAGRLGGARRAQLASAPSTCAEPDVAAVPALDKCRCAQWRRHDRPSRWSRSSALGGPHVPAA